MLRSLVGSEMCIRDRYYTISSAAASTGSIHNSAEAKAKSPGSIDFDVIETSDDGDDTDDNTTADTYISPNPSIEVIKTYTVSDDNPDGQTGEGDTITYTIVVENTGNVNLTEVAITDTITDGNNESLTLTTEPAYSGTGTFGGNLASGDTVTYTATYLIDQSTSNSGSVINQAEASGTTAQGVTVTDLSDDGDTGEGDTGDDPTITPIEADPAIEVTKMATVVQNDGNTTTGVGDEIQNTITYKPNRAVIFPGKLIHYAEAPHRYYSGLRVSLAYKLVT